MRLRRVEAERMRDGRKQILPEAASSFFAFGEVMKHRIGDAALVAA